MKKDIEKSLKNGLDVLDRMARVPLRLGFVESRNDIVTRRNHETPSAAVREFILPGFHNWFEIACEVVELKSHIDVYNAFSVSTVTRGAWTGNAKRDWRRETNYVHEGFDARPKTEFMESVVKASAEILGKAHLAPQLAHYNYEDAKGIIKLEADFPFLTRVYDEIRQRGFRLQFAERKKTFIYGDDKDRRIHLGYQHGAFFFNFCKAKGRDKDLREARNIFDRLYDQRRKIVEPLSLSFPERTSPGWLRHASAARLDVLGLL